MTCPHCGHEADPDQPTCPLCGTPLQPEDREAAGAGRAAPGDSGDEEELTPWEAGGGAAALLHSWWKSLVDPSRFYSRLEWEGGLERPLLYYLLFTVVGAGFQSLWHALLTPALLSAVGGSELVAAAPIGSPLLQFFLSPFKALFGLALAVAFLHPLSRLASDRARSIGATARVVCYAAGPQVLLAVPVIGGLAGMVWSAVLVMFGVRAAHRTSTARAVAVLGVSFLLVAVLATIFTAVMIVGGAVESLPLTR